VTPASRRAIARAQDETEAWQALRALVLDRHDRRRQVAEELGLSFVRVKALRELREQARTMSELAGALGIDAPFATVVVDDLERRGLVARRPHPSDRRAKLAEVTAEGRSVAARAERMLSAPPAAMRALSDDDVAALRRIAGALLGPDE
jgi:DNA-binding MarR family transcriptional regulator